MPLPVQCSMCSHYRKDNACDAYPKGIPVKILTGEHDHREPYKGDDGIRFEPI